MANILSSNQINVSISDWLKGRSFPNLHFIIQIWPDQIECIEFCERTNQIYWTTWSVLMNALWCTIGGIIEYVCWINSHRYPYSERKKKRQISSDNFWLALICEIVLVIYLMFFCLCSHTIQSHTFSLSPSLTHSFFSCVSLNTHFSSTQKCVNGFNCCIFTDCVNNLQTKMDS